MNNEARFMYEACNLLSRNTCASKIVLELKARFYENIHTQNSLENIGIGISKQRVLDKFPSKNPKHNYAKYAKDL